MKIEELMNDAEFKAQVQAADNLEEVVKLAHEKGVQITVEELAAVKFDGELDETALDCVAGGKFLDWLFNFITPSEKQIKRTSKEIENVIASIDAANKKK